MRVNRMRSWRGWLAVGLGLRQPAEVVVATVLAVRSAVRRLAVALGPERIDTGGRSRGGLGLGWVAVGLGVDQPAGVVAVAASGRGLAGT